MALPATGRPWTGNSPGYALPRGFERPQVRQTVGHPGEEQRPGIPVGPDPGQALPIREVVAEYEAKESAEALCARDADELDCMLRGIEYKARGYETRSAGSTTARADSSRTPENASPTSCSAGSLDWLRTALGEAKP